MRSRTWPRVGVLGMALGLALSWMAARPAGSAETPRRPPNRLAKETSPYLRQHAHNPVDWYPWGPEAFEKARKEDRPIFLSIGYSSCHWCHVMARESFEDEGVAKLLNDHFVSIKVDREERPDLDELYLTAVQLISGRAGWPMSVFLTPQGKPFHGGTYFPRADFAELLRKVEETWRNPRERERINAAAEKLSTALGSALTRASRPGSVSPSFLAPAANRFLEGLDPSHGGFGRAPKFPPPQRLAGLLAQHRRKPDKKLLHALNLTLDRMARGGIYDHLGGGFHRYSVDEQWLVPHFEKMLYDQAQLAWIYLDACRETGNAEHRRIGVETLRFALRELRDPRGGFWSTLDADSPGKDGEREEGAYYLWTPAQVTAVLGPQDGALFNRVYGITEKGNFEGRSIPNLLAKPLDGWAKELKTSPEAFRARLDGLRRKLAVARNARPRPPLDDKVLASWNGLMIRALALAYEVTGDAAYRKAAEDAATFVLAHMRADAAPKPEKEAEETMHPRRLVHSHRAGATQPQAFLEDYSFMITGLLELYRATRAPRWLEEAQALTRIMVADFWDEDSGRFYSTPHHHEALIARSTGAEDGAMPSGQSMAAVALVRLARLTGDPAVRDRAVRLLDTYTTDMKRFPEAIPTMLLAAFHHFDPADELPGRAEDPVRIVLEAPGTAPRPGADLDLKLRLSVQNGWHIGAAEGDGVVGTSITLAPGPFQLTSHRLPTPKLFKTEFAAKPLKVYEGEILVPLKVRALPGAEKASEIRVRVRYQACNQQVCRRPAEVTVTAALPGQKGRE